MDGQAKSNKPSQFFFKTGGIKMKKKWIERKKYFLTAEKRTDGLKREGDSARSLPRSKSILEGCRPRRVGFLDLKKEK